jgi:NAD(P)-dependent dehydrogenase (short-subunit alcohol dehydrogenase family)
MQLENTVALVTGANRGVGREFVLDLLERGAARVYATARDVAKLESLVAAAPDRIIALQLDVEDLASIQRAAERARDVTILINNAGVLSAGGPLDVGNDSLDRDLSVNLKGLLQMTRHFAPIIAANGGGAVINMLSLLSFVSAPIFSAYNVSKAAAWSMTMSLRPKLLADGIRTVNAFPAGIDTDMLAGVDGDKDAPRAVAHAILDAVEAGQEDVYPCSAAAVYAAWRQDPKQVERNFGTMG